MGRLTFTEYFHLLLAGEEPTEEQRFFLDLLLVSIAEHGMMPTNVAARMTLARRPGFAEALQPGSSAQDRSCSARLECARLLEGLQASGRDPADAVQELLDAGGKVPGFGHPVHRPVDPGPNGFSSSRTTAA